MPGTLCPRWEQGLLAPFCGRMGRALYRRSARCRRSPCLAYFFFNVSEVSVAPLLKNAHQLELLRKMIWPCVFNLRHTGIACCRAGAQPYSSDSFGARRTSTSAEVVHPGRCIGRGQGSVRRAVCLLVPQSSGDIQPMSLGPSVRSLGRAREGGGRGGDYGRLPHAGISSWIKRDT